MAENEDGQDKSEDPTSKKQSEARKKGQLPRSKEMTTFFGLLMAIIGLILMWGFVVEFLTFLLYNLITLNMGPLVSMGNALLYTLLLVATGGVLVVLSVAFIYILDAKTK